LRRLGGWPSEIPRWGGCDAPRSGGGPLSGKAERSELGLSLAAGEEGNCQGRAIKQTHTLTEGSLLVTPQVLRVEALTFRASKAL